MATTNIHELRARFGQVGIPLTKASTQHDVAIPQHDATADSRTKLEIPSPETSQLAFPIINEAEKTSIMGTPIFFPCKIGLTQDSLFDLPNEPAISISGMNRIIKTELTKLKGSFKERMQLSDYAITIQGVIINEDSEDYPAQMVAKIRTVCEAGTCYVQSELLKIFNVTQLAIEKFDFSHRESSQNEQDYTITAISDRPIELIIKDEI